MRSAIQESNKLAIHANMLRSPVRQLSPQVNGLPIQEASQELLKEFGDSQHVAKAMRMLGEKSAVTEVVRLFTFMIYRT